MFRHSINVKTNTTDDLTSFIIIRSLLLILFGLTFYFSLKTVTFIIQVMKNAGVKPRNCFQYGWARFTSWWQGFDQQTYEVVYNSLGIILKDTRSSAEKVLDTVEKELRSCSHI